MKLPNPKNQPYKFIDCSFHPRLEHTLKTKYKDSEFVNCDGVPSKI